MQGSHLSLQNICGVDLATGGKAVLVPTCYPLMLAARVEDMFGLNGARVAWGALFAIGLSFGKLFKRAKAGADRNVFAPNGADLASKRLPVCRAARFASILAVRFTKLLGKASATPRWLQNWLLCQTLSDGDAHLLKSGVPQASDWLRLCKAVTSTSLSLRSLQELSSTDSFVSCDRADPKAVTREACLNMINIFVDLIRDEKRASTDDKSA